MPTDPRYRSEPDRPFLHSREWRERIRPQQLAREPLCRFCDALDIVKLAEQVDHIKRPKGDRGLQRHPDNLQSLCAEHHLLKSNWERAATGCDLVIGTDKKGWLITARNGTLDRPGGEPKFGLPGFDTPVRDQKTINRNNRADRHNITE